MSPRPTSDCYSRAKHGPFLRAIGNPDLLAQPPLASEAVEKPKYPDERNRVRFHVLQTYFFWIRIVRFAVSTSLRLGMRNVRTPSVASALMLLSSTSEGIRKFR